MIQIIGLLLCIYLVFKGYEILQIALCSTIPNKSLPVFIGALFFLGGIVIAVVFAYWLVVSGNQMQNQIPQNPR